MAKCLISPAYGAYKGSGSFAQEYIGWAPVVTILHILNGCSRRQLFERLKIVHVIVSLPDYSDLVRKPSGVTAYFLTASSATPAQLNG